MKKVAIIGATGRLAPVVITQLIKDGFQVRAIVRNPEKAAAMLPKQVEIVKADLTDVAALKNGLSGMEVVYINLSTELPDSAFQPELDGVKNILEACQQSRIQRIFKISGLGAYRKDFAQGKTIFINEIRSKGHDLIRQSGIPYTLFHPTWFLESLEMMFHQGNKLNAFKPVRHPLYWIAGKDYAQMVSKAIERNDGANKDYIIQGPEAVTMHDALVRYSKTFEPPLQIAEAPVGMIKFIGIFSPKFKILGMMAEYFKDFKETFVAAETWAELGKPVMTIETFK